MVPHHLEQKKERGYGQRNYRRHEEVQKPRKEFLRRHVLPSQTKAAKKLRMVRPETVQWMWQCRPTDHRDANDHGLTRE